MDRWPSPASLAAEESGEAVRAWGRLGYPRRALRLHVAEENQAAVKFYRHWGFNELSSEPGSSGRLLLMEKKLGGHEHV